MPGMRTLRPALLLLLVAACGPAPTEPQKCDAANCAGCCDAAGLCDAPSTQFCGAAGSTCSACALTATCQFGQCTPTNTCRPTSCAAEGKNCGMVLDGCGGTLTCGACEVAGESCGAGGQLNVCGARCVGTCPASYACDAQGVCAGGNPTGLVLDVPVPPEHLVSGVVHRNGVSPTITGCNGPSSTAAAVAS